MHGTEKELVSESRMEQAAPVRCTEGRRNRRRSGRMERGMWHGGDDAEDDADHEENGDDAEENAATCCIGGAC